MSFTWYYGTEENLKGPFTKAEIRDLIKKRAISPETILWLEYQNTETKKFHKKPYPAIKTEFSVFFPQQTLSAVAADPKVPDYWLWLGAFCPLVISIAGNAIHYSGWEEFPPRVTLSFIVVTIMMFTTLFIGLDVFAMILADYRPPIYAVIISFLYLFPVYYFQRNRRLGRSQFSSFASLACWALALSMHIQMYIQYIA